MPAPSPQAVAHHVEHTPHPPAAAPAVAAAPREAEPIAVAPVVQIAEPIAPRPTVLTCARCQGQNDTLARFCKYCGAPLGQTTAGQGSRSGTTGPTPPVFAGAAAPRPIEQQPAPAPVAAVPVAAVAAVPVAAVVAVAPVAVMSSPSPAIAGSDGAGVASQASALGVPAALLGSAPPAHDTVQTRAPKPATLRPPQPAPIAGAPGSAPAPAAPRSLVDAPAPVQSRPAPQPAPAPPKARARLVVVVEDGSDGKAFELVGPEVFVGRSDGDVLLFDDPYVSPRHARIHEQDGRWSIQDLRSLNGVYVRVRGRRSLESGDLILLGSQVLQFQLVSDEERQLPAGSQHGTRVFGSKPVTRLARLDQRSVTGLVGDVYYLFRDETILGREMGDIVFTADAFLSRRHAAIRRDPSSNRFHLDDLDSSNGTYVAIRNEATLSTGDRVRIGQHLFRFESGS